MNIVWVHNAYTEFGGEDAVVQSIPRLLEENGNKVFPFMRSSAEIPRMRLGNERAFFSGIYNWSSKNALRRCLEEFKPDIVHVHNVFPLISPSVLGECRRFGVPVVMTTHNFRLICPNGPFMTNGEVCEKCSGGREYWCVLRNCEGNLFKSFGYALRNYVARKRRMFLDNVTLYACLSEFQRRWLTREAFPVKRIVVVPHMVDPTGVRVSEKRGEYVGYVGRVSPEKGLPTLMEAARVCDDIQFKAAGSYDRLPHLPAQAPENFEFCGHLNSEQVDKFYANSRIVVLCSIWYEAFGLVVLEAMIRGRAVICSRIGGLPEIVEDGVTGLLFEPGNAEDLAEKLRYLWDRPELCHKMGQAGREKALREYSPEKYYERLIAIYKKAIEQNRKKSL